MNESECLAKMYPPGKVRPLKAHRGGVIQIAVTRACDKACFHCTQGSNLAGRVEFMSLDLFEQALESLSGYWGIIGLFGGNPALSPHFEGYCELLRKCFPREQLGIWCNHPKGKGRIMAETFSASVSNLNVHLDQEAYREFLRDWPEARIVGLHQDSRHAPVFVAMKDVLKRPCDCAKDLQVPGLIPTSFGNIPCPRCHGTGEVYDESRAWELISTCDINQRWSALLGVFRGELRAWFCEVAGAQAMLHQHEPDYPDTGIPIPEPYRRHFSKEGECISSAMEYTSREEFQPWWERPMSSFAHQVRKHCHDCGVPLRGYGQLSQHPDRQGCEQVSATHESIGQPKRKERRVELVTVTDQLHQGRLERITDYLGNSRR